VFPVTYITAPYSELPLLQGLYEERAALPTLFDGCWAYYIQ